MFFVVGVALVRMIVMIRFVCVIVRIMLIRIVIQLFLRVRVTANSTAISKMLIKLTMTKIPSNAFFPS